MTAPHGVLLITAGIDFQHDRIAIVVVGWGRNEESWRLYWDELHGDIKDEKDPVWGELDKLLSTPIPTANNAVLGISAASLDSSDGNTNDSVYSYVRTRQKFGVMAIKGASIDSREREIYARPPQSIDASRANKSKAAKYGLRVNIVGTHKAKTLIDQRLRLMGTGPGRMHWYQDIRADYFEQLTTKCWHAPAQPKPHGVQLKSGAATKHWTGEVYALHAARSLKRTASKTMSGRARAANLCSRTYSATR